MISPAGLNSVYLWAKVAGALGAVWAMIYSFFRWAVPKVPFVKKVTDMSNQVNLLATNHLPHIEQSIKDTHGSFQELRTDFKVMNVKVDGVIDRLDETKLAVNDLGKAFMDHLEHNSKEPVTVTSTTTTTVSPSKVKKRDK